MASRNKIYYPKSHTITNLFTVGGEYMTVDGVEYTGFYHRNIDATVFTGAVYSKSESKKLVPYIDIVRQPSNYLYEHCSKYKRILGPAPKHSINTPTEDDFNEGMYIRYIIRRRNYSNSNEFVEVNSAQYKSWKLPGAGIDEYLFDAIKITWKLTGPLHDTVKDKIVTTPGVYDTNYRTVLLQDIQMPGLKNYLTNYLEHTIYGKTTSEQIKKTFGLKT